MLTDSTFWPSGLYRYPSLSVTRQSDAHLTRDKRSMVKMYFYLSCQSCKFAQEEVQLKLNNSKSLLRQVHCTYWAIPFRYSPSQKDKALKGHEMLVKLNCGVLQGGEEIACVRLTRALACWLASLTTCTLATIEAYPTTLPWLAAAPFSKSSSGAPGS